MGFSMGLKTGLTMEFTMETHMGIIMGIATESLTDRPTSHTPWQATLFWCYRQAIVRCQQPRSMRKRSSIISSRSNHYQGVGWHHGASRKSSTPVFCNRSTGPHRLGLVLRSTCAV
jgi:hypothetical protein